MIRVKNLLKRLMPQQGPLFVLTLIGILLLTAVLYYRAIKVQRFLEPALAISQPRNEFAQNINKLLSKEFGNNTIEIRFMMGSILIEESVLFAGNDRIKGSAPKILKKLSNVFISALDDENMRSYISNILIIAYFPLSSDSGSNNMMRTEMQHRAELILDSMYKAEPKLKKDYGTYFAATAMPVAAPEGETGWIMFRIIPSELVHIEVLQRLHKYIR
jgi:hypothetical protein